MSTCPFPGCTSIVDETGFCEDFGHPSASATVPEPAPPGSSGGGGPSWWRPTNQTWWVAGIVALPVLSLPDQSERILDPSHLPYESRVCGFNGCRREVGASYEGQAPLSSGYCPRCGHPFSFEAKLTAGELVADRYEVIGPVGRGGLGWVYLARDNRFQDALVVLKGLINAQDPRGAELAAREREALRLLDHPNIVRIFDAVSHRAPSGEVGLYTVMEYLRGPSLQDLIDAVRRGDAQMPLEELLAYGHEILAALSYLHDKGWLYCDMKPDNVLRGRDGVKLIDLNAVRRHDDRNPLIVGHPKFRVPLDEIRTRGLSVRSDLFGVGRTLAELFEACSDQRSPKALGVALTSFGRLVARATDKIPDGRFASAAEMSTQLVGVLREAVATRTPAERTEQSAVFLPTPSLVDDDLSAAPPVTRWIEHGLGVAATINHPPSSRVLASSLPIPTPAADDPAAGMLVQLSAPDPLSLLTQLHVQGHVSLEVSLRRCRAYIELDDADRAEQSLREAAGQHSVTRAYWRIDWYTGLLCALRGDVRAAATAFGQVIAAVPGEVAPKLALGLCLEWTDESTECERYLTSVWRRDRSQASAAFALARRRLAAGDRSGAVAVLDEVPPLSRHFNAAGIAAVRAWCEPLPAGPPTPDEVRTAAERLVQLRQLDGGDERGATRDRLTAVVQQAALRLITDGVSLPDRRPDPVLGHRATEATVRRRFEDSLRRLARQAGSTKDFATLVDLANAVRPRTLVSMW